MNIKATEMQAAAAEASDLLKALAHPHRLMIVCRLLERPRPVGELASLLNLRDSAVSQHLALLRKDGLVEPRRDGQTIWYSVASAPARALLETIYRIYCPPPLLREQPKRRRAGLPGKAARGSRQ